MQDYINQISQLSNPSFQQIRRIAINSISHLSTEEHNELYHRLKRGVALLHTHEEMCQYLLSFGNMHQAKLLNAIQKLPLSLLDKPFEVIDWGCGQAMGTINLFDYLKSKGLNDNISKITLVEPSKAAIDRGIEHITAYSTDDVILNVINSFFEDIGPEQINSQSGLPQIHIFSNILDVAEIDLKKLATRINSIVISDNYLVCVGPLNSGNRRIDAFYDYFNVDSSLNFNFAASQFEYGGISTCTYKAKVYKLEITEQGILRPIEFYPSVQFHSSYQLDCVRDELKKNEDKQLKKATQLLNAFEVSTPFDIGANVYDDIHPIFAVLNNIITRGLPTKASPYVESIFQNSFGFSETKEKYGTILFPRSNKRIEYKSIIQLLDSIQNKESSFKVEEWNSEQLQLIFSPIAIARVQKAVLEAVITGKLNIFSKKWTILAEEKDVPCAAIAMLDLSEMFNKLTHLSVQYQDLVFPEFELDIISNRTFWASKLHLNKNVSQHCSPLHLEKEYDFVIDISIFETSNILQDSFSRFRCKNNCYFNIRSSAEIKNERTIYTSDKIQYRNLVSTDNLGVHTEIEETKEILEYFVRLIFRKKFFRAGQLPILNRALQNKSVIGLLPTGGGKSLTYQLAAMLQPGVTLIVDPLRSLMKDQFDGLINVGIDACEYINSTLDKSARDKAESKMEQSKLLFVFLSPERLAIYNFREKLKNMHKLHVYFSYGVLDEVHCVSEWGHDFRFSYLHLGRNLYNYVRAKDGSISLFGLTATASFDVLADVERELSGNGAFPLDSETIVRYENSNRLELQYKIEKVTVRFDDVLEAEENSKFRNEDKVKRLKSRYAILSNNSLPLPVQISNKWAFFEAKNNFLKNYIKTVPNHFNELLAVNSIKVIKESFEERQGNKEGIENDLAVKMPHDFYIEKELYNESGIVFCPHRANTGVSVHANKESVKSSIPDVKTFTGGDDDNASNISMENLDLFRDNKSPLMVATKAFGMGIDKPNVRFTINMNYSSSLESFVQEAGRSGRDRKLALSVILLSDYKLARINRTCPNNEYPLGVLKGEWFNADDFLKIQNYFNIDIDRQYIDFLSPENDFVRLFCKDGEYPKYFNFKSCNDKTTCNNFDKCQLRYVPKEAENWIYKTDLDKILQNNKLTIDKKHIEYQNADYETVMFFYNNSFKGEYEEKKVMHNILNLQEIEVYYDDESEENGFQSSNVKGFLDKLLKSSEGQKVVSYIEYIPPKPDEGIDGTDTEIAKAIYRMTCIELIEDFTQDYVNNRYRIVSIRKKEGEYYDGLRRFLLRYYSHDRAEEELKKAQNVEVRETSGLKKEIYQCLSFLTTFVYDKISVKRKRAIDDMRTFCLTGVDSSRDWKLINEELKDFIFYYFNSKYAKNDYVTDNGEPFSLVEDTDEGKVSNHAILYKYLRVIDDDVVGVGTPLDNIKHLYGAVRLISRSLTDSNPALSMLEAFCLAYIGTRGNTNLENQLTQRYSDGLIECSERSTSQLDFWKLFEVYNEIMGTYIDSSKLYALKEQTSIVIHSKQLKKITSIYTTEYE